MQESVQTFSYTAQKNAYLSALATISLVFVIEGGVYILLIIVLIHNTLLKWGLLAAIATLLLFLYLRLLLAPLWTKHRLSTTHLRLRFGFAFNAIIPRESLVEARPVRERLTLFRFISAGYNARQQRITACFSEQGQIVLRLSQPLDLKIGRKTYATGEILLNVDQQGAFLAALALSQQATIPGNVPEHQKLPLSPTIPVSGMIMTRNVSVSDTPAIRTEALTLRFGSFTAVDNLSIAIQRGEIYGFLGANGAGKTTTIKMLVGLLEPSSGHAWIDDHDIWAAPIAAKTALGYVADRSILYERLTGREFLLFLGQVRGLSRTETEKRVLHLLALLNLEEHADRLCSSYSFGMKRKVSLAGALLHQPHVLILDEPLNGLDPRSARRLKDLLCQLAAHGTAIMLSTHDLATAEEICHRIGIIHRGKLLAEGNATELRQLAAAPDLEAVFLSLTEEQLEEAGA